MNAFPTKPQKPLKLPSKNRPRRRRFPWWTLVIIALCLAALGWAWVQADAQIDRYATFSQMRDTVSGNRFFGPVSIDGISITGMTMDEARAAVDQPMQRQADAFEVILTAEGERWRIASDSIPMQWDTETLLQKAYRIGRVGTLQERYREITSLAEPIVLTSTFTYDKDAVRDITDGIARHLTEPAKDAAVTAFDLTNRTFAFSEEQPGRSVDPNGLYETVIHTLDNGEYGSYIAIHPVEMPAVVTRAGLEQSYTRIASFTTKTTSEKNRNNNIDLAAQALNGTMIPAGGEISFNETTGERTPEKGYLEAGAIENGRTIQEYGGGVCQVSSTMFNALTRANCEIVTRRPHAWPSDYVPMGEDATVDWPRLDLVMRNASSAPMFVTAWYADQTVTVEVYGLSLGDGVSIELDSEVTYRKEPTEVVYTYNANLPVGATERVKKPRTGYSVQTYKVWLQDGVETAREAFYKSEYGMISEEYEYNDGKGPPEGV